MNERHYNHGDYGFVLESLSDSLVRVTHRDQTGYLGIIMNWDAGKPYAALTALCNVLLHFQRIEDSKADQS